MDIDGRPSKPLGIKSYGSIGHLPGSRLGPGDHSVNEGQERICCTKARDRHDRIIVTEKVDGTNVGVARIGPEIVPLIRAGYRAMDARYEQHHLFGAWALERWALFEALLADGERVCGEWLAQAHGTRYDLTGRSPFVAFDIISGHDRVPWDDVVRRIGETAGEVGLVPELWSGAPIPVADAMALLGPRGRYGAIDPTEGVVYRVERRGEFDFMAKWVRPDKVDGSLLPELSGEAAVWNWRPEQADAG